MDISRQCTPAFLFEHYTYEIDMLRASKCMLDYNNGTALGNALYESFCVHARALNDFFTKPPSQDDAVASHFTETPFVPSTSCPIGSDLKTKINKQVAHLTYSRSNAAKLVEDDLVVIVKAIEANHKKFVSELKSEFRDCSLPKTV
jgi:hypothetical protein